MDRTATMKETTLWVVISFIALTVLVALMVLSQIANISIIIGTPAPNLAMTTYHAPKMAGILVFLVVAASFTTAAPVAVIAAADTKRFKIIGIGRICSKLFRFICPDYQHFSFCIWLGWCFCSWCCCD